MGAIDDAIAAYWASSGITVCLGPTTSNSCCTYEKTDGYIGADEWAESVKATTGEDSFLVHTNDDVETEIWSGII